MMNISTFDAALEPQYLILFLLMLKVFSVVNCDLYNLSFYWVCSEKLASYRATTLLKYVESKDYFENFGFCIYIYTVYVYLKPY